MLSQDCDRDTTKNEVYLKFAPLTVLPDEFRLEKCLLFGRKDAGYLLQNFPL